MSRRFATTQWSVVLAARDGTVTQARQALELLCESYWYPIYAYIRRRGHSADESRDLTQAFFADLLSRKFLERIDRSKGRFRSFLLVSLEHFLSHERDKAQALKQGGGVRPLPLDALRAEERYQLEPADRLTPEAIFERRWGLSLGAARVTIQADLFNALNTAVVLRQFREATATSFGTPQELVAPRLLRLGVTVQF